MISNKENLEAKFQGQKIWHYLAVKNCQRGITSKLQGDFYCLNYLHCFAAKNKLEPHKKYAKIKSFVM